jgi:ferredoxin
VDEEGIMASKTAPIQVVRRVTLGVTLGGLIVLTVLHQKMQGIPSIDALDPFGGLETMMKFIAGGEFIKKIEPGTVVLFGAVVALGIVLSRFFCGWFCAFGALQAVFGWLGKKIFKRRFTVPKKLDSVLRWIKYPVLAAIIYFTWTTASLVIRPFDPLAAFGHLSAGFPAVWAEFAIGFVILIAVLVFSMLYERVFCKYLCPLGAVNAILSRIPVFRIKRVASTCISCSKCDKACPMNIDVSKPDAVTSPECISCMECVTACPTKKPSLAASLGGKAVKLGVIVAIGFGIYLGAAAVGQALGMLRFSAPSLKELSSSGTINVADIKGSSTYEMVAESFGIELERLYREVGVDMKKVPPSTMLKDTGKLAGIDGFEADAVRVAVAKILGIPYAGERGEAKPSATTSPAAVDSTKSGEAIAPAASAKTPASQAAPKQSARSEKPATAAENAALVVPADFALEGTMTIQEIAAELKASAGAVIKRLGLPADIPTDKPLRDMKDAYGFSMPDLKAKIKE